MFSLLALITPISVPPPRRHPLGSRASKSHLGILTVRFELPFHVWCTTCPKPTVIGQGVRFNAEKKKVGNYYSTPIFSFTFKHTVCGGAIEIQTDPKNTAYVVISGAKKRDYGDEKAEAAAEAEGGVRVKTQEEREELERDAFKRLEGKVEEKEKSSGDKSRIEELYRDSERRWEDPYELGRRLRRGFRVERKERERLGRGNEALKEKMSLGIEVLAEEEEDRLRAALVDFGGDDKSLESSLFEAQRKPKPDNQTNSSGGRSNGKRKKRKLTEREVTREHQEKLRSTLGANTRAAIDPFLNDRNTPITASSGVTAFKSIKRKSQAKVSTSARGDEHADEKPPPTPGKAPTLVDYDSD